MTGQIPLISVCVCTYKRPGLLARLLASLALQVTNDEFGYEVIVVDNDTLRSAAGVVEVASRNFPSLRIAYAVEHIQGVSFARNRTVEMAAGEYLAFIDDDEFPQGHWLRELLRTMLECGADAVLGPVLPTFPPGSAAWVIKSKLFERPRHANRQRISSREGRTGNALVKREWLARRRPVAFDAQYARSGGEDFDFFRWMEDHGGSLYWSDGAAVTEFIPHERQTLWYILGRRFSSSVVYWRSPHARQPALVAIPDAIAVAAFAVVLLVGGVLTIPFGWHRTARIWARSMSGFGRLGALTRRASAECGCQNG